MGDGRKDGKRRGGMEQVLVKKRGRGRVRRVGVVIYEIDWCGEEDGKRDR